MLTNKNWRLPLILLTALSVFFTVSQGNVMANTSPIVGTWAVGFLHHDYAPKTWYSEASKVQFNSDGTGKIVGIKNDGKNVSGERIKTFEEWFTYNIASNPNGILNLTMNFGDEGHTVPIIISDNGNMFLMDRTQEHGLAGLSAGVKLDTAKTYSNADLSGDYYFLRYVYNLANAADPPKGSGRSMAVSGVNNFNGIDSFTSLWTANSKKLDGSSFIWIGNQNTGTPYTVSQYGELRITASDLRIGGIAGNSKIFGVTGSYNSDNWTAGFSMKKGDKSYATADLAGKWAYVSFFEDNTGLTSGYGSSIGTLTCGSEGVCVNKLKRTIGSVSVYTTETVTLSVGPDGSFGGSLRGGTSPAYAGAIGNDGNTMIANLSVLNSSEIGILEFNREIAIGVRASSIGDIFEEQTVDTDKDGLYDAWEMMHFGNLVTANSGSDSDGDGYTDKQEYLNSFFKDPSQNPYDPKVKNAPGGKGYSATKALRNVIVLDFGDSGLWLYDNALWQQLTGANADKITVADIDKDGKDDIMASFPGYGIYAYYSTSGWAFLTSAMPEAIVSYGNGFVGDFGASGLYSFDQVNSWQKLADHNADNIVIADINKDGKNDIIACFPGYAIYIYCSDSGWKPLTNHSQMPEALIPIFF